MAESPSQNPQPPSDAPLVVEEATKHFRQGDRDVPALAGVSLEVQRGLFLAIMGASGSGKSTLLHLMAGLTLADGGRVVVNGQDLGQLNDRELTLFRRRNIGLVFQSFNLIPTLTAEENIALPLMLEGRNGTAGQAKVDELLRSLSLEHRKGHRPDAMSGGEQQRVAIGRALVTDPAVILADEPTGNLDSVNSQSVCELLRDLSATHGKTIVMVTHEPSVAAYAQQVVVLKDGKVIDRFDTQRGGAGAGAAESWATRYQQDMTGTRCPSCGAAVPAGGRFCPGCGKAAEAPRGSTGLQPVRGAPSHPETASR